VQDESVEITNITMEDGMLPGLFYWKGKPENIFQ
jgi:hypothetical protein